MKERTAQEWLNELEREEKVHRKFRNRSEKIVERYEDDNEANARRNDEDKFNILWSNEEVLHSALYAKTPNPEVRRRYLDRDPVGKQAAEITERAVSYSLDTYDFDDTIDNAITDYLVPGMGQVRMRYKPYFEEAEGDPRYLEPREMEDGSIRLFDGDDDLTDGEYQTDENGFPYRLGEMVEKIVYEEVTCEEVNWRRFRWQPCQRWADCDWAAIEHLMDTHDLEENYGEETAKKIPMGFTEKGMKRDEETKDKGYAMIFEIFDRKNRKVYEIAYGRPEILKEEEDPLQLEGFYPFPKPLIGSKKNGKFIPIPDYHFYQDQARELDIITDRIHKLTAECKYRGLYDASLKEMLQLETAEDGKFIAVDMMKKLVNASGQADIGRIIAEVPLAGLIAALQQLYIAREEAKQVIYEITGIADIMRGNTNANETLGAQQLKTQFGSMRMWKRQRKTAKFIRDIIKLKAEIMVENFQPATLEMMTGMELTEEVYSVLTNDLMRSYRIDIETDSTIAEDASQEKQDRIELVSAVTEFLGVVGPMVQAGAVPDNVAKELLGFAVRGFKIGRTLEETLDEMGDNGEEDPRITAMRNELEQVKAQIQEQAEQQVMEVSQRAEAEIDKVNQKLFETEKQLAIERERTGLKREELAGKEDLEIVKAQIAAIQQGLN